MVPASRFKLQSFLQKQEAGATINPHGPSSPPRQAIAQAAVSNISPILARQDRQVAAEALKIPMPMSMPPRRGKATLPDPASPQIKEPPSQQRDEGDGEEPGWEPAPEELHRGGGLKEVWEEQSTIDSLFSEGDFSRPAPVQPHPYDDDTSSDIVDNRQPPQRGRHVHQHNPDPANAPFFKFENGELKGPTTQENGFSTSMITHAPANIRADAPNFKRDPFGSTSADSSPKPPRDASFMRSAFPIRGNEEARRLTHLERASYRIQSARRVSNDTYDSTSDVAQPPTYVKPVIEPAPVAKRSKAFQALEKTVLDWDDDDSDVSSQGDEFEEQEPQRTPKAARTRVVPDDTTVILNPQKPIIPQKSQKTVVLQDDPLLGSPLPRAHDRHHATSKKRRHNIDYDDAELQKMSFTELQNEPFDHDPAREVAQSPAKPPADNLGDRLTFYFNKDKDAQADFFTKMPIREWEDSGDWFLEQFGDIVSKMKEARLTKRKIVEQYETEVSSREEEVRRKKEYIDYKLSKLKQDSAAMLLGNQSHD
ncbi:hypothetical protein SLS53_000849 [Cytospora paraplurivora]|uniref:Extracellular mutant protein 11 C-terminal domain-containing protein n=1 Tax=Cytospora paraplurivora TaxID=2898453 RepID=A0AAN9ULU3_9PEZI